MDLSLDQRSVNAIRMLSVDQINRANSGHPGITLGAAPMAYRLFTDYLRQNPADPTWTNRDRFILSAGHGSALLYSLLHLSGYAITIEDLKNFRQLHSKTPGHPEVNHTPGVEATTGPLGQGIANAVGMAMAEVHLAALFNKENYPVVDHYTYSLVGDGDLMEGVSAEAASLAGRLGLGKLIVLYDSNHVCLDGKTEVVFTEDVAKRFAAYGWQVLQVADGNDLSAISAALQEAQADKKRPTLIEITTIIGYGSPEAGTSKVHGAPLGVENTKKLRNFLGWKEEPFVVPADVYQNFQEKVADRGAQAQKDWEKLFSDYEQAYPDLSARYQEAFSGKVQLQTEDLPSWSPEDKAIASRSSSQAVIQALAKAIPSFWGGSADLSGSNKTTIQGDGAFRVDQDRDRNIYYGVREHAMAAINNGIALHGGSKIFGATFFVFSDYLRGAVRVAALSKLPITLVLTHDSIAVGEDGPTHEPIEQLAAWRAMPNLDVLRPADANEVAQAWRLAVESQDHPTLLVLSRQNLPNLPQTKELAPEGVERGAYVLSKAQGEPTGILLATGSEVSQAILAQEELAKEGIYVNVVSMPSLDRFEAQDQAYQDAVLPPELTKRLSIEAGVTFGWERYLGPEGRALGIDRFGLSAPGDLVQKELGMTAENIVKTYKHYFAN